MAYGFGNTVNPQLGATNYSGFLQGALTGAQMQAQGGAAIAQGLASAGKSIGAGIEKYQQNKILQAEIMGGVEENISFLAKKSPGSIAEAPAQAKKILARMEDGKGVSVQDSAYLKSWSDSTTKQAKINIENNAFVKSLAPIDGKDPTGTQAATTYFREGGQDKSFISALLSIANEPANAKLRELQIIAAEQATTGGTPMSKFQEGQTQLGKDEVAVRRAEAEARTAAATVERERQRKADDRAADANKRAEDAATASKTETDKKKRLETMANKAIGLYERDRAAYSAFFNGLAIEDQGVVLSAINQFERGTPRESALTPSATAELLGRKSGGKTLAAYIASINSANIAETADNKYVVRGMFNDIKRIPEFDLLLKQYPQIAPVINSANINLPSGGRIRQNNP